MIADNWLVFVVVPNNSVDNKTDRKRNKKTEQDPKTRGLHIVLFSVLINPDSYSDLYCQNSDKNYKYNPTTFS